MDLIPIHNSDQETFLSCRRRWDLTSVLRQKWRPDDLPKPLKFGICMHQGYEVLYRPELWNADRDVVLSMAIGEFLESMRLVKAKFLKDTGIGAYSDEQQAEYLEMTSLGPKMLTLYHMHMQRWHEHLHFTPLGVEEEWEVPLDLTLAGRDLVFRFRTDLRLEDEFGGMWLWDHKTTARMSESVDFLSMDPQMGKYLWGLRQLGLPVVGAIYNEQYKGFPDYPVELKVPRQGRRLSVNKQADTNYDLFLAKIVELGEPLELYTEYLDHLKSSAEVKQWVRRTQIHRSATELHNQGVTLKQIAIEMLNDPVIYPSPSKWKCDWCMVRDVCLQMNDGSDWEWTLRHKYHQVKDHYDHAV